MLIAFSHVYFEMYFIENIKEIMHFMAVPFVFNAIFSNFIILITV